MKEVFAKKRQIKTVQQLQDYYIQDKLLIKSPYLYKSKHSPHHSPNSSLNNSLARSRKGLISNPGSAILASASKPETDLL